MEIIFWLLCGGVLLFGFVVLFGPPYVPTMVKQIETALDLLDLPPGATLLELGAGDGRVMKLAARRGLKVVGIELNPLLVLIAWLRCWRYRKQVRIIWGNIWAVRWPQADGVFTFLLGRQMQRLDMRIAAWHTKPLKLVSFAFRIPSRPIYTERDGVFVYEYR